MDMFTQLFWMFFLLFYYLSGFLLCCTKRSNVFYLQISCGIGMFVTSKIGRTFLGLAAINILIYITMLFILSSYSHYF
jgi:hypothetical protein